MSQDELVRQIHELQEGWTRGRDEERLAELICGVRGIELTYLKTALDRRDGHHDLEQLVFGDIGGGEVRDRVVEHIAREARPLGTIGTKVLSDIDDTVFPMIHEDRYPHGHTPVPGVLAFLEALDEGPQDDPETLGDITFVTARPSLLLGLLERSSKRTLQEAGITGSSILTGPLTSLRSKDAMAGGKLDNVAHYRLLYPEYAKVFVGDSGQGDIEVGRQMRQKYPDAVPAVFIHDVVAMPEDEREPLRGEGVHVVDTYVGAAVAARDLGLVSDTCVARVVAETREALDEVAWESAEQERATRALVDRDIART